MKIIIIEILVKTEKDDILTTPDPTKYEVKDLSIKTPQWQIGKAKRECVKINSKTPGSGEYDYQTFIGEGPKYSFRPKFDENGLLKEKRHPRAYEQIPNPGPGTYDLKDNTKGPEYTIGTRHYPKKIKGLFKLNVPGVGSYDLAKNFDAPCCKIDQDKRKNLNLNETALKYPGPNKYVLKNEGEATKSPQWTFSKSVRFDKKPKSAFVRKLNVPGPGSYNIRQYFGFDGPKFTFNKVKLNHADAMDEFMFRNRKNYPAPGTYGPKTIYTPDTPLYSIPRFKRVQPGSDKFLLSYPGPEKYKPNKDVSSTLTRFPQWKLSPPEEAKPKKGKKIRIETPGPGKYHSKYERFPNGPKYSMGRRFTAKRKKEERPGPGKYNSVSVHFPSEPKYSFGKEKRKDEKLAQTIKDGYPGPDHYKTKDCKFNQVGNFTKDKRYKTKKYFVPGPGQYKIPTAFDYIADYERQKGSFNPIFRYV